MRACVVAQVAMRLLEAGADPEAADVEHRVSEDAQQARSLKASRVLDLWSGVPAFATCHLSPTHHVSAGHDGDEQTPLQLACAHGDLATVQRMVEMMVVVNGKRRPAVDVNGGSGAGAAMPLR